MIEFGNLEIKGFCSIQDYILNLSKTGITIIRGRNGSGKTTLISAINWVLYGVPSKETKKGVNTWKRYQPKDYIGTMVSIFWSANGAIHNVIRCSNYKGEIYGSRGGDRLVYLIDNEHVPVKRKPEIQALIVKNLGMSLDLFRNSIMFGQGLKRLTQESGSDKKELFEEVFDITYLSEAHKLSKSILKSKQEELSSLKSKQEDLSQLYNEYRSTYTLLKSQTKDKRDVVANELLSIKSEITKLQKEISKLKYDENRLAKAQEIKAGLEGKVTKLKTEYKINASKLDIFKDNEGIGYFIDDLIHYLDLNKVDKVKKKLTLLKDSLIFLSDYNKNLGKLNKEISNINDSIYEIKSVKQRHNSYLDSIKRLKSNEEELKSKPVALDNEYKKYKKKYLAIKPNIIDIKNNIEIAHNEVNNYRWLIDDPLGNKGIKSYIIENMLGKLNDILLAYSSKVGFRVEFSIDLESTKKDFYTLIEIDKNIVDYSELSGGQKQLVNVVMAFAMHEMTSMSKGVNILFLDEIFESLDSDNIEVLVSMIRSMTNKSIYIITHLDSLPLSNSSTLKLGYNNGVTKFN